jgi:WD40 repeat protein
LISGSKDTSIRIWDWENGKEVDIYEDGHNKSVNCLIVDDENTLLSGSDDFDIKLWNFDSKK